MSTLLEPNQLLAEQLSLTLLSAVVRQFVRDRMAGRLSVLDADGIRRRLLVELRELPVVLDPRLLDFEMLGGQTLWCLKALGSLDAVITVGRSFEIPLVSSEGDPFLLEVKPAMVTREESSELTVRHVGYGRNNRLWIRNWCAAAVVASLQKYHGGDHEGLNSMVLAPDRKEESWQVVTSQDFQRQQYRIAELASACLKDGAETVLRPSLTWVQAAKDDTIRWEQVDRRASRTTRRTS